MKKNSQKIASGRRKAAKAPKAKVESIKLKLDAEGMEPLKEVAASLHSSVDRVFEGVDKVNGATERLEAATKAATNQGEEIAGMVVTPHTSTVNLIGLLHDNASHQFGIVLNIEHRLTGKVGDRIVTPAPEGINAQMELIAALQQKTADSLDRISAYLG